MATANLLQTSVSGGTQNALSLQGDGVFFPKASTTSRLALTLTTTDKGFIVYDTTDNNIYFWNGAAWESIPGSGDAGANGSVQYNDNGIVSGASNFVYDKATSAVAITGDLTVRTTGLTTTASGVGINTAAPTANTLTIGASRFILCSDSQSKFGDNGIINGAAADANTQIQYFGGKALFFNEGVATRMTLNATGLGIGASPASYGGNYKTLAVNATDAGILDLMSNSVSQFRIFGNGFENRLGGITNVPLTFHTNNSEKMQISASGNVGIGVTPKSWASGYRALQIGIYSALTDAQGGATYLTNNAYFDSVDSRWEYITNNRVVRYDQDTADGGHKWYSAGSGAVNAAITWGNPLMTLDSAGNLILQSSATPATLTTNGQLTVNATSNTNLRFSYRGSDGTTRVANITLA